MLGSCLDDETRDEGQGTRDKEIHDTARDEGLGTGDEGTALLNSQGRGTRDKGRGNSPVKQPHTLN